MSKAILKNTLVTPTPTTKYFFLIAKLSQEHSTHYTFQFSDRSQYFIEWRYVFFFFFFEDLTSQLNIGKNSKVIYDLLFTIVKFWLLSDPMSFKSLRRISTVPFCSFYILLTDLF